MTKLLNKSILQKKNLVQNLAFVKSNLDRKGTLIKWPFPRENKKIEKGTQNVQLISQNE